MLKPMQKPVTPEERLRQGAWLFAVGASRAAEAACERVQEHAGDDGRLQGKTEVEGAEPGENRPEVQGSRICAVGQ